MSDGVLGDEVLYRGVGKDNINETSGVPVLDAFAFQDDENRPSVDRQVICETPKWTLDRGGFDFVAQVIAKDVRDVIWQDVRCDVEPKPEAYEAHAEIFCIPPTDADNKTQKKLRRQLRTFLAHISRVVLAKQADPNTP